MAGSNHLRRQVRDLIFARLVGLPTSGPRVYKGRVFQMSDSTIPGLTLYTTRELVELKSVGYPRLQRRELKVVIEAYAKASSNAEDILDDMAREVELVLSADNTLGGKVMDLVLEDTDIVLDDADRAIAVATMNWVCRYNSRETAPDTFLN